MYRPIAFEVRKSGGLFKSCRFITIMHSRLKVPAKNSPALLFLSRVKAADCCCFSFFFFSPAEEEQSRGILGGNFQTRMHDGNKAAGLKETTWQKGVFLTNTRTTANPPYQVKKPLKGPRLKQ